MDSVRRPGRPGVSMTRATDCFGDQLDARRRPGPLPAGPQEAIRVGSFALPLQAFRSDPRPPFSTAANQATSAAIRTPRGPGAAGRRRVRRLRAPQGGLAATLADLFNLWAAELGPWYPALLTPRAFQPSRANAYFAGVRCNFRDEGYSRLAPRARSTGLLFSRSANGVAFHGSHGSG